MEIDLLEKELDKQSKKSRAIIFTTSLVLLLFMAIAITFPLRDKVLNLFYPKQSSRAAEFTQTCTPCQADIDQNGVVGQADYTLLDSCMNKSSTDFDDLGRSCLRSDVNGDGMVNMGDQQCLVSRFGNTCNK